MGRSCTTSNGEVGRRCCLSTERAHMPASEAQLVSLPDAEHMLHVDQPQRWVEIVTQAPGQAPSPTAVPRQHPQ